MTFFRVRLLDNGKWVDVWWGANADDIPPVTPEFDEAPVTCKLTIEQAKCGLARARANSPDRSYGLKRYEE